MERYNILPADTYIVINKSILNNEDRTILNMLYQPIIGPLPIMLYFSLWSDLDKMNIMSDELTHHHLVSNMHLSLDEIILARKKLEAIGLVKTYYKEGSVNNYVYELYSPLSAHEFLTHPILNIVLYNNTGKKEYENIINYFKLPRINLSSYTDVTSSFSDIFTSVPLTSYEVINDDIRKENKLKLNINSNFDFNFLSSSFPKGIDANKVLNKDNRELILNLSCIYDIDAMKMQNIIKGCFNERGTISKDELRKACRNYYQFDHGGVLPTIVDNVQPEYLRKPIGEDSKRAKMIYTFETTTPYELLCSKNGGAEPTKRDLRLIEDLMIDYSLKAGVVNVLIDYVLKTNNNKLSRNLVETVAGQWQRLKIETVEDAMSLAEKEHKKYNKVKDKKVSVQEEKIPEWFDKKIEKKEVNIINKSKIDELLKEYR